MEEKFINVLYVYMLIGNYRKLIGRIGNLTFADLLVF